MIHYPLIFLCGYLLGAVSRYLGLPLDLVIAAVFAVSFLAVIVGPA